MKIKKGDLIIFDDNHRLLCGDSTTNDMYYLINGLNINNDNTMIFTDPPYNAEFNGRSGDFNIIKNDSMNEENFYNFIRLWYIKSKEVFGVKLTTYIWCNNYLKNVIENIHRDRWLKPNKRPIIWVKNNFGMGTNYRPKYEMLLFDGKIDKDIKNECDVWNISKDDSQRYIHPTQKPIQCFSRGIKNHLNIKYVVDVFAGSGSSLIASQLYQKTWLGMELDENYCEKILRRYYDFTTTNNIKIIRDNKLIEFNEILDGFKLLDETDKKGNKLKTNIQTKLL